MNPFYFAFQKQKVGKSVQTIQLELSPNTHFTSIKQSQDSEFKGLAGQLKVIFLLKVFKICFILFFWLPFSGGRRGGFLNTQIGPSRRSFQIKGILENRRIIG